MHELRRTMTALVMLLRLQPCQNHRYKTFYVFKIAILLVTQFQANSNCKFMFHIVRENLYFGMLGIRHVFYVTCRLQTFFKLLSFLPF